MTQPAKRSVHSMTGYGQARYANKAWVLWIEIRTVNHRYFAWHYHAPPEWQSLDLELQQRARAWIQRGDIRVHVRARYLDPGLFHMEVHTELVRKLVQQLELGLAHVTSQPWQVNLDGLLQLPGMFALGLDFEVLHKRLRGAFLRTFDRALRQVVRSRAREGKRLVRSLDRDLRSIERALQTLQNTWPTYLERLQKRWTEQAQAWLHRLQVDAADSRVWSEIALWIHKADAREELDRLHAHVQAFRDALATPPVGRRLEFIAQEMHREASTLVSKWQDTEFLPLLFDVKGAIDRLREQVQNLE